MSRYDLFRKRLAPVALGLAIALIARDSCQKSERTHANVELAFEPAVAAAVRAVDVQVVVASATIATFHRAAMSDAAIGPCRFPLSSTAEDGELRIDLDLGAAHRKLTRPFHAVEGSTITVPIGEAATR